MEVIKGELVNVVSHAWLHRFGARRSGVWSAERTTTSSYNISSLGWGRNARDAGMRSPSDDGIHRSGYLHFEEASNVVRLSDVSSVLSL